MQNAKCKMQNANDVNSIRPINQKKLRLRKSNALAPKKNPLTLRSGGLGWVPGSALLSHGGPHYHRRWAVSLPRSGWDRVVPARHGRQAILSPPPPLSARGRRGAFVRPPLLSGSVRASLGRACRPRRVFAVSCGFFFIWPPLLASLPLACLAFRCR